MNDASQIATVSPCYRRSKDVVDSKLDDSFCLFHLQSCEYFSLNETGSAIWGCLDKPVAIHTIVDRLLSSYDVDAIKLYQDLEEWLLDAAQHGLVDVIH
jgi:hypothetical protein